MAHSSTNGKNLGKPFDLELSRLPETYQWALEADCGQLIRAFREAAALPLLAVGSGGSFTTAEFAATAHREMTGRCSTALTPLECVASQVYLSSTAVFMATAGGRNPDVLGAFRMLAEREPRRMIVLCLTIGSPLARAVERFPTADLVEFRPPFGKDGFLATNSLLASAVLILRAYSAVSGIPTHLPQSYSELELRQDPARWRRLWDRETLVVLHGPSTRTTAIDIESKFTEAALGNVRAADYRHFAHGRHHWLSIRSDTTSVITLTTSEDEELAAKTLEVLPSGIPIVQESIPFAGLTAAVAGLVRGFKLAGSAGVARGIDPGRPHVADFGRRLYHLRAFRTHTTHGTTAAAEDLAIERKAGRSIRALEGMSLVKTWRNAYAEFNKRLRGVNQRGIVLDYDGTICSETDRTEGLSTELARELTRLLRMRLVLGVATGRGKSVRIALREAIPKKYWSSVVVGYYSGGDVALLDDALRPDGRETVTRDLIPVADALKRHPLLSNCAQFEFRQPQIKVEPTAGIAADFVWDLLRQTVMSLSIPGVSILRSGHSIDIHAPGVDKRAVVVRVGQLCGDTTGDSILRIGDKGRYPGNDHLLLSHYNSLSVDEASPDPLTCWNLAPAGSRSVDACLEYLGRVTANQGVVRYGS